MMLELIRWLFIFVMAHAMGDFALQSAVTATQKKRGAGPPPNYDPALHGPRTTTWPYYLGGHALINASMVYLFSGGNVMLSAIEFFAHWFIDFGRGEQWYGPHIDQLLHFFTKVVYAGLIVLGVV